MARVGSGRRRLMGWRGFAALMLAFLAALLVWSTVTPQGRTAFRAALFVPSLIPNSPIRPITWFTRDPQRLEVTFSDGTERWVGDLWLPGTSPPHPGIIVALGVTPAGRDDPRVKHLGDGLARMGLATLIPVSQNLVEKRVTPREVDFLVAAFQYLAAREEVDRGRVGFLGVCVGSSLSLLAAQDVRIRDRVAFVNWFGGYYWLDELIASTVTRSYEDEGRIVAWQPDRLTREVVRLHILDLIGDTAERQLVRRSALEGAPMAEEERSRLSAAASVVHRLLVAGGLEEARGLIGQLPAEARDRMRALSPATNLAATKTRLYLMDDSSDRLVPFVHTRALASDLQGAYERHSKFSIFSHVDLDRLANPIKSAPQLWGLYRHVNAVFQSVR